MPREVELDELVEHFTLLPDGAALLRNKSGATRLGFALLLKFFTRAGRFPSRRGELADEVAEFVARQVEVPAEELGSYDWSGRTITAHRAEVRRVLGFRECTVEDAEKLTEWLAVEVAEAERPAERVHEALMARCREERLEPPATTRVARIVASALHRAEDALFGRVAGRIDEPICARLRGLVADTHLDDVEPEDAAAGGPSLLGLIRSEPGSVSLRACSSRSTSCSPSAGSGWARTCSPTSHRRSSRGGARKRW